MPKVSIITPCYNCKEEFSNTFNSVINQTYKDFEWIIIDDCSNDDSFNFIAELIKPFNNFKLLKTKNNSGPAVSRNLGIKEATGDYIAFLDSDDKWKENKLEKQIEFMESTGYVFTYTNYDVFENGKSKLYCPKSNFQDYKKLLRGSNIGCSTVIYNCREIGKKYMPIDVFKREDYAMWLDITKNGVIAHKLNDSLTIYTISRNSFSSKKLSLMPYAYKVYRKHEKMNIFKSHFYLFCIVFNKIFFKY